MRRRNDQPLGENPVSADGSASVVGSEVASVIGSGGSGGDCIVGEICGGLVYAVVDSIRELEPRETNTQCTECHISHRRRNRQPPCVSPAFLDVSESVVGSGGSDGAAVVVSGGADVVDSCGKDNAAVVGSEGS